MDHLFAALIAEREHAAPEAALTLGLT